MGCTFLVLMACLAAEPPAKLRTWTDVTGNFKVDAELVKVTSNVVQLRKANGKVVSLPLSKLSVADQQFLAFEMPVKRQMLEVPFGFQTTWSWFDSIYGIKSKATDLKKAEVWKSIKGKTVLWTGEVTSVNEMFGALTLQVRMNSNTLVSDLLIRMKKDQRNRALALSKGDRITFRGVLDDWGMLMPSTLDEGEIASVTAASQDTKPESPQRSETIARESQQKLRGVQEEPREASQGTKPKIPQRSSAIEPPERRSDFEALLARRDAPLFVEVGDQFVVTGHLDMTKNPLFIDEVQKSILAKDEEGYVKMQDAGMVGYLPEGCHFRVLAFGQTPVCNIPFVECRIIRGEESMPKVYIPLQRFTWKYMKHLR